MNGKMQKLIKPMIFIAAAVFAICCLLKRPAEFSDYTTYIGYSITGTTLLFVVYEKWLWKRIPWNRPPILKKQYSGIIRYHFNGIVGEKPIDILIQQSWSSIDIKTKTDINSSFTITAAIVSEFGQAVLYYTYLTNPSAATQKNNPIQHGTCRMILEGDNSRIKGKYWTSSLTSGDMEWISTDTKG